jgi:DNA mismatch repair protein MutL
LIESLGNDVINFKERVFQIIACRSAIKAGDILSGFEIEKLAEKIDEIKTPYAFSCAHGRPTIKKIKKQELEKEFKRR